MGIQPAYAVSVPEHTKAAIWRYVVHRIPPGSFVRAVLENDLTEAVMRADDLNLPALAAIVAFVVNEIPLDAWGSKRQVSATCEHGHQQHLEEAGEAVG